MYSETQWLDVEFEEDARNTAVVLQLAGVMRDAVLVRLQRLRARSDVRRRYDM